LLEGLQSIERKLGSRKEIPRGPRIIDLDILFYDTAVIQADGLEIPHPRLAERRFVLVPLAELAPNLRHPVSHITVREMLAIAQDRSEVRVWTPEKQSGHS
jgi:7,8-dihydro-6-hydroxymethylpterin-pyrophosphokinase